LATGFGVSAAAKCMSARTSPNSFAVPVSGKCLNASVGHVNAVPGGNFASVGQTNAVPCRMNASNAAANASVQGTNAALMESINFLITLLPT